MDSDVTVRQPSGPLGGQAGSMSLLSRMINLLVFSYCTSWEPAGTPLGPLGWCSSHTLKSAGPGRDRGGEKHLGPIRYFQTDSSRKGRNEGRPPGLFARIMQLLT